LGNPKPGTQVTEQLEGKSRADKEHTDTAWMYSQKGSNQTEHTKLQ